MAVSKTSGTRLWIGPVVNPDIFKAMSNAQGVTNFEAVAEEDWIEVEEIENFGEFGDASGEVNFTAVKDRRTRGFKTSRDAGTIQIICGRDPLDEGQIALAAGEQTDFNYRFRVRYADARDEEHSDSTDYFAAQVMTRRTQLGTVQDITKKMFNLRINTAIFEDPSDPTGS